MIEQDWHEDEEAAVGMDDQSRLDAAEMLRRYRYWEQQKAATEAPFVAEIERLKERLAEVRQPFETKLDWYRQGLEGWHRSAIADNLATPTVKLPYGDMLLRKAKPLIEIEDEAEVLAWAAGEGYDILPDPKVNRTKLAKVVTIVEGEDEPGTRLPIVDSNGEAVPGLSSEARERSFSISKNPFSPGSS